LLGEPIGSSILAFLLLGEAPTVLNLIGAILILIGIALVSQGNRRNRRYELSEETVTEL
jgi:drug/metabolite transporter (DMT)-like permease